MIDYPTVDIKKLKFLDILKHSGAEKSEKLHPFVLELPEIVSKFFNAAKK